LSDIQIADLVSYVLTANDYIVLRGNQVDNATISNASVPVASPPFGLEATELSILSPSVPSRLVDLAYWISVMVDAEIKSRCPTCPGLSTPPFSTIFNISMAVPSGCSL